MCSSAIAADWHKPDNTANLFVAVSGETDPHVFRVTMELYDTVSQHFLQKALEQTLPYFRAFNVKFKRHFFRRVRNTISLPTCYGRKRTSMQILFE